MAVLPSSISASQLVSHSYTVTKSSYRQPGWQGASTTTISSKKRPLSRESSSSSTDSTSSGDSRSSQSAAAVVVAAVEGLSSLEARRLRLYLKSSNAIAKLCVADIMGAVNTLGHAIPPSVRLGKLNLPRSSTGGAEQPIKCSIISSYPFERCEIVGTITKKRMSYIVRKRPVQVHQAMAAGLYDRKGKGKATQAELEREVEVERECINLVFYDIDDGSGATITALVSPASVHGMSLQQQFDSHFPPRRRKTSNSSVFNNDFQAPPPASDPRLWVYRYSKPPPPIKTINQRFTPTLKVPLYEEGTVVRITGSIVLSPKNQWERQIDVKTLVPIEGTAAKYAEHHHAIAVRNLKRDLYCNPAAVADKLVLTDQAENDRMQLDTKPSSSVDSSQADRSSLTELGSVADASGLTDVTDADVSFSYNCTTSDPVGPSKRRKLPSLRSLAASNRPIDRPIFQLYVHQHFRDESKMNTGRLTLGILKNDKKLDWLVEQTAKAEARAKLATSSIASRTMNKAASSMIMPSSSPLKSSSRMLNVRKVKIERSVIDKAKISLWSWVIRRLHEDGVIVIRPATLIQDDSTPKAKRSCCCACETGSTSPASPLRTPTTKQRGVSTLTALSPRKANSLPGFKAGVSLVNPELLTPRKASQTSTKVCTCTRASTSPRKASYTEEKYQLITPALVKEQIKPIYTRMMNDNLAMQPARVASSLRRDEMWQYVSNELVAQAIAMM